MIKPSSFVSGLVAAAALIFPSNAFAQDPVKVDPSVYKVKLEEKGVRVLEVSFEPGQKIATHSHPDHVVYAITAGSITITEVGKEPKTIDAKVGDAMYLPAQTHHAQNTGKTPMKLVVVELPKKD